jgi:hypothetical protein
VAAALHILGWLLAITVIAAITPVLQQGLSECLVSHVVLDRGSWRGGVAVRGYAKRGPHDPDV